MRYRYGVLSLLLFFIVLILGYKNYQTWSSAGAPGSRTEGGKKAEGKLDTPSGPIASREAAPLESFRVIAEKNVFHPERQEFPSQPGAAPIKPVTRPPITLYGVVMVGDYQSATIINPGRPLRKGEREAKTLKVGDMVGEYKLTKILPDRIVMQGGEDSFEVLLYDPLSPKKRVAVMTPAPPAKVTSPVSGPTPAEGAPATAPPAGAAPAPATPSSPVPRPATPVPVPPTPIQPPGGTYQPQSQPSAPTPSPPVPDPGLWRRRPSSPGGSSG
jgi:hypothetical protein